MKIFAGILFVLVLLVIGRMIYLSLTSKAPETKLVNGLLRPCPDTPNCVSSEDVESTKKIAPIVYTGSAEQAWNDLRAAIGKSGGVVKYYDETYLRAVYTSRLFRFVDDMEFRLVPESGIIHVRSASRVGKSDLGVNRKNIEKVRLVLNQNHQ
ncbi:MAG: hypothetical protein BMS9Abin25_0097 [Gammaproteobacteria bacterium]|nr:MAG: hypothetical protein BMS9Abin25_0097 [Gammaproteobacteria bacterium]